MFMNSDLNSDLKQCTVSKLGQVHSACALQAHAATLGCMHSAQVVGARCTGRAALGESLATSLAWPGATPRPGRDCLFPCPSPRPGRDIKTKLRPQEGQSRSRPQNGVATPISTG